MTFQTQLRLLLLLMLSLLSSLAALRRDETEAAITEPRCHSHRDYHYGNRESAQTLGRNLHLIPSSGLTCDGTLYGGSLRERECGKPAIFCGYFQETRYLPFFVEYLCFIEANPCCTHLWPETSAKAATISNVAHRLFTKLLSGTALRIIVDNVNERDKFKLTDEDTAFEMACTFVNHSFFFSTYEFICRDLEAYSSLKFQGRELEKIQDQLNLIRETLIPLFLDLYQHCPTQCQSHYLTKESDLLKEFWALANLPQKDFDAACVASYPDFQQEVPLLHRHIVGVGSSSWVESELLLCKGIFCAGQKQYGEAIDCFTQAIQRNQHNFNAYIERALCYLETEDFASALKDYHQAKAVQLAAPVRPEFYIDEEMGEGDKPKGLALKLPPHADLLGFSQGMITGVCSGSFEALKEFGPNILSACQGVANGLWAFACSPKEVSRDLLDAAYALGAFISEHESIECLECVVPEIKEIRLHWHQFDDPTRGSKMGYLIGKYGMDVFLPLGSVKAVKKRYALKRSNALFTLEICQTTPGKQLIIAEENAKRAAARAIALKEAKKAGRILVRTPNAIPHIMQKKHDWHLLVELTGNIEQDFQKVTVLLEQRGILSEKYFKKFLRNDSAHIVTKEYEIIVGQYNIVARFEEIIQTSESYLMDAWVETVK